MDPITAVEMTGAIVNGTIDMAASMSPEQAGGIAAMIAGGAMVMNIVQIALYLLQSWGLWQINKKLGEPHAWLSWVPVLQIYSFVRASGKPNTWILWWIIGTILFVIPGAIIAIIIIHNISKRTGGGVGTTLGFIFLPFIFYPLVGKSFMSTATQAQQVATPVTPTTPPSV